MKRRMGMHACMNVDCKLQNTQKKTRKANKTQRNMAKKRSTVLYFTY